MSKQSQATSTQTHQANQHTPDVEVIDEPDQASSDVASLMALGSSVDGRTDPLKKQQFLAVQRNGYAQHLGGSFGNRYLARAVGKLQPPAHTPPVRRPIQPQLTVNAPDDVYEQEADAVSESVMRVASAGELPPDDEDKPSTHPPTISRLLPGSGAVPEVTPELEQQVQRLQGHGQSLPGDERDFFESRMGQHFGAVRVHTDSSAAQLSQALSARAFTVGSDIAFGEGEYAPSTTAGRKLLAHELTHVVQQTKPKTLQQKHDVNGNWPKHKQSIQAQLNLDLDATTHAKTHLAQAPGINDQATSTKSKIQVPAIQLKRCAACEAEDVQRKPAKDSQTKCTAYEAEDGVKPKTITEDITRYTGNKSVQKLGVPSWNDVTNAVSAGAQWVGERAGQAASMGREAFAAVVAQVAPSLANLIQAGPIGMLTAKIKEGIQGWLSGIVGNIDVGSVVNGLKVGFSGVFGAVTSILSGDPAACPVFAASLKSLHDLGQAFMDSPAIKKIQAVFAQVSGVFNKVTNLVVAPVFDALMSVAGGVFNSVKGFATTIWSWGKGVRDTLGAAWVWVKQQLGIDTDGETGILDWLKTKASEAWTEIKDALAPVAGPLRAIGTAMLAFSPAGPLYLAVTYVPKLTKVVEWLWAHKDDPDIVRNAHKEMGDTILPELLTTVQGFGQFIESAATSLIGQATQLSEAVLGLLGAISGVPLLSMAQGLVERVSESVKSFISWCEQELQTVAKAVVEGFGKIAEKVKPYIGVLTSIGLALANPGMIPVILAGWAWQALDDCYKGPIIDFLLDIAINFLAALPDLPGFMPLWPLIKSGVIGFLQGFKTQDTPTKVAVTNRVAKIISGASPAFMFGYVKGFLKGIWEGVTGPFVLIYDGVKLLGNLTTWLTDLANDALGNKPEPQSASQPEPAPQSESAPTTTSATATEASGDAVAVSSETRTEIGQQVQAMKGELEPPVSEVVGNFMPAMQEAFSGGEGLTFQDLMHKLGEAWGDVQKAITAQGASLAESVCKYLMQESNEGPMGEAVGNLAGQITVEVVIAILTAGSGTAAKGAIKVLQTFARILDWTGEALGLAFKALAKLGGYVLDFVKGIGKLLSNAGGAVKKVLGALGEIGEKLIKFADALLAKLFKKGAGKAEVDRWPGEAHNAANFERLKARLAQEEILGAEPVGSALKGGSGFVRSTEIDVRGVRRVQPDVDVDHSAPIYEQNRIAEDGRVFPLRGDDGKIKNLTQMPGEVNGAPGIYEYIVDEQGNLTHQQFRRGGQVTGTMKGGQRSRRGPGREAREKAADKDAKEPANMGVETGEKLRNAYESEVRALSTKAEEMRRQDFSPEQIARELHAKRRELGIKYKGMTSEADLEKIYARNIEKYGDPLGPTVEWLRSRGKSWEDIIDSAGRPGGKDIVPKLLNKGQS